MNKEAFGIEGYLHKQECELLAEEASKIKNGIIVELGSYVGKSTAILASNTDDKTIVYAIDLWKDINKRNIYKEFLENTEPWIKKIIPLRINTHSFIKLENINNIDLLFIDADHSYDGCFSDLKTWYDKVKSNGIILLHDYTETTCGVKRASDEFFINKNIKNKNIISSILMVQKC